MWNSSIHMDTMFKCKRDKSFAIYMDRLTETEYRNSPSILREITFCVICEFSLYVYHIYKFRNETFLFFLRTILQIFQISLRLKIKLIIEFQCCSSFSKRSTIILFKKKKYTELLFPLFPPFLQLSFLD